MQVNKLHSFFVSMAYSHGKGSGIMTMKHQQMIPSDLSHHPRPGEREIYIKAGSMTHRERPNANGGEIDE